MRKIRAFGAMMLFIAISCLVAGTFAAQQLTGNTFIVSYCIVFAQDLGIANPFAIGSILNCLAIVAVLLSWLYIERFSRRTILIATTTFMLADMLVIGGLACGPQMSHLVPVPILARTIVGLTLIYLFCFNLAWGPLAWTVATEICVGRNRPRIMAVATSVFWIFSWLVTFTLPYLYTTAQLGAKVGFVYFGSTVLTFSFVWFALPETRGRSLEEIEEMFNDGIPARKWKGHQTRILTEALTVVNEKRAEADDKGAKATVSGANPEPAKE